MRVDLDYPVHALQRENQCGVITRYGGTGCARTLATGNDCNVVLPTGFDDVYDLFVVLWQSNRQRLPLQGAVIVAVGTTFGLIGQQGAGVKLFSQLLEKGID